MTRKELERVFETRRLVAVHWRRDHAEEAFGIYGDPEVGRFIGGHQPNLEAMRDLIEILLDRRATLPAGMGSFPLHLEANPAQPMVGTALIKPLPDREDHRTEDIEIGWHLHRAHWGNGFATEAGLGLLGYAFSELGLSQVHAVVDPRNAASHAVAGRLGLRRLGISTDYYGGREVVHYRIERDAWRATRADQRP